MTQPKLAAEDSDLPVNNHNFICYVIYLSSILYMKEDIMINQTALLLGIIKQLLSDNVISARQYDDMLRYIKNKTK